MCFGARANLLQLLVMRLSESRHDQQSAASDPMLILVDDHDNVLGHAPRTQCHDGDGLLHRAFSVLLFDDRGRLLLQKRSAEKRLWPGFWSGSCCSHPVQGEPIEEAAKRRLREELGVDATILFSFKFGYRAKYMERGSEREICSVYTGNVSNGVRAAPREISDWRFAGPAELDGLISRSPDSFTPWFLMQWRRLDHARPEAPDQPGGTTKR